MPFYLKTKEDLSEFDKYKSVLIVPCRFCPAASSAVQNNEPYIELFRKFLKTDSYEKYIKQLKSDFERKGIRTEVFKSKLLHQFVLCMWTSKRRKKLSERAEKYDALIVLGCEAAVQTIQESVKSNSCEVFQGLDTEGIMSIQPKFKLLGNILLDLQSVTPLQLKEV